MRKRIIRILTAILALTVIVENFPVIPAYAEPVNVTGLVMRAGETYEFVNNEKDEVLIYADGINADSGEKISLASKCESVPYRNENEKAYNALLLISRNQMTGHSALISTIYSGGKTVLTVKEASSDMAVHYAFKDNSPATQVVARKVKEPALAATKELSAGEIYEFKNTGTSPWTVYMLGEGTWEYSVNDMKQIADNSESAKSWDTAANFWVGWHTAEIGQGEKIVITAGNDIKFLMCGVDYLEYYGKTSRTYIDENAPVATEDMDINLPVQMLETVVDRDTAVSVVKVAVNGLNSDQKKSPTGIDMVTLYAEEAVAQAASMTVESSDIVIDKDSVNSLQATAKDTGSAAGKTLASSGIITVREMNTDVKFKAQSGTVKITIDSSAANTTADNVRVETPDYAIAFPADMIKSATSDSPLIVTITEGGSTAFISDFEPVLVGDTSKTVLTPFKAGTSEKTYAVSFNKNVTQNVKVSLPAGSGNSNYKAAINSQGNAVGGKYNPITDKMEVKIKDSGTYNVKENKKDFTDIKNKSKEMQDAITILASKGILGGTSATTFSPDKTITRAEIASIITHTLAKYDANANGGFSDVKSSDWFCGAVGSAKKYKIMNGITTTTFSPKTNIQKDQIMATVTNVLKTEMKYKEPSNAATYLSGYTDKGSIPSWVQSSAALATRENLVVKRTDGKFNASEKMTRGDAAIVLYRMFNKIW